MLKLAPHSTGGVWALRNSPPNRPSPLLLLPPFSLSGFCRDQCHYSFRSGGFQRFYGFSDSGARSENIVQKKYVKAFGGFWMRGYKTAFNIFGARFKVSSFGLRRRIFDPAE